MWLLSRIVIVVAIQLVAPSVFTSPLHPEWTWNARPHGFLPGYTVKSGWELFSHWDGKWYRTIAHQGYEYVNDGQQHSIAFFPLFPLLVRIVMGLGLPFEIAGVLINNLAFFAAMLVLYFWAEESQGTKTARWVTAVFAWYPGSLFGTVTYTEGLFLLVTTKALRAFDHRYYGSAAFWGALASATRVPGIALLPAFLFVAWRERRQTIAYVTGLVTSAGLLIFSGYATVQFGDPLAFVRTQQGWGRENWAITLRDALLLNRTSVLLVAVMVSSFLLLWHLRSKLPTVATAYGFCVLLLLLLAGSTSFYRCLYGIASTSFGIGILLADRPRWGYLVIVFFGVSLFLETLHFASWDWIRWD